MNTSAKVHRWLSSIFSPCCNVVTQCLGLGALYPSLFPQLWNGKTHTYIRTCTCTCTHTHSHANTERVRERDAEWKVALLQACIIEWSIMILTQGNTVPSFRFSEAWVACFQIVFCFRDLLFCCSIVHILSVFICLDLYFGSWVYVLSSFFLACFFTWVL